MVGLVVKRWLWGRRVEAVGLDRALVQPLWFCQSEKEDPEVGKVLEESQDRLRWMSPFAKQPECAQRRPMQLFEIVRIGADSVSNQSISRDAACNASMRWSSHSFSLPWLENVVRHAVSAFDWRQ